MLPAGIFFFELTVSARERPQTYALDDVATGTGGVACYSSQISI